MGAGFNSRCTGLAAHVHAVELLYVHTNSPINLASCLCTEQLRMVCAGSPAAYDALLFWHMW